MGSEMCIRDRYSEASMKVGSAWVVGHNILACSLELKGVNLVDHQNFHLMKEDWEGKWMRVARHRNQKEACNLVSNK